MSDYTVTIRDDHGTIVLDAAVDATLRKVHRLALEPERCQALLVTAAVVAGVIEAVCAAEHVRPQPESRATKPATAAPPGHVFGGCEDPANNGAAATQTLEEAA